MYPQDKAKPRKKPTGAETLPDLPPMVRRDICRSLDSNRGYADLAEVRNYSQQDLDLLTMEASRPNGSPAGKLFMDWEKQNPRLTTIFKALRRCKHKREMEYLKPYVPKELYKNDKSESDSEDDDDDDDDDDIDDGDCGHEAEDDYDGRVRHKPGKGDPSESQDRKIGWMPPIARESSWQSYEMSQGDLSYQRPRENCGDSDNLSSDINANLHPRVTPSAPMRSISSDHKELNLPGSMKMDSMHQDSSYQLKYMSSPQEGSEPKEAIIPLGKGRPNIQQDDSYTDTCSGISSLNFESPERELENVALAATPSYSIDQIRSASKNWDSKYLIGTGSFGSVYNIYLPNISTNVVVKKLEKQDENLLEYFISDLKSTLLFRHENIVRLLGYSFDVDAKCLIYEYMANGSLHDRLQCKDNSKALSIDRRVCILKEISRAICYLHNQDDKPLIHANIKSSNILLDRHFEAKLSDFGLAKQAIKANDNGKYTQVDLKTNKYVTSMRAYLPRTFVCHMNPASLSVKTDVHCFGVVIMEALTGMEAAGSSQNGKKTEMLKDKVENCSSNSELLGLLDQKAGDARTYPENWLIEFFDLAKRCAADLKKQRPNMDEVYKKFEDIEMEKLRQGAKPKAAGQAVSLPARARKADNRIPPNYRRGISEGPTSTFRGGQDHNGVASVVRQGLPNGPPLHLRIPSTNHAPPMPYGKSSISQIGPQNDINSADIYQSSHVPSSVNVQDKIEESIRHIDATKTARTPLPITDCSLPLPLPPSRATNSRPVSDGPAFRGMTSIEEDPECSKIKSDGDHSVDSTKAESQNTERKKAVENVPAEKNQESGPSQMQRFSDRSDDIKGVVGFTSSHQNQECETDRESVAISGEERLGNLQHPAASISALKPQGESPDVVEDLKEKSCHHLDDDQMRAMLLKKRSGPLPSFFDTNPVDFDHEGDLSPPFSAQTSTGGSSSSDVITNDMAFQSLQKVNTQQMSEAEWNSQSQLVMLAPGGVSDSERKASSLPRSSCTTRITSPFMKNSQSLPYLDFHPSVSRNDALTGDLDITSRSSTKGRENLSDGTLLQAKYPHDESNETLSKSELDGHPNKGGATNDHSLEKCCGAIDQSDQPQPHSLPSGDTEDNTTDDKCYESMPSQFQDQQPDELSTKLIPLKTIHKATGSLGSDGACTNQAAVAMASGNTQQNDCEAHSPTSGWPQAPDAAASDFSLHVDTFGKPELRSFSSSSEDGGLSVKSLQSLPYGSLVSPPGKYKP